MDKILWIKKIYNFNLFIDTQKITEIQKQFGIALSVFRSIHPSKNGILLTQIVEDYESTIKLAAASKVIADEKKLTIHTYDVHIHKSIGWADENQNTFDRFFKTPKEIIHENFSKKTIFRNDEKYHDQKLVIKELARIRKEVNSREDLLKVQIDGLLVGDLIYDTYLRFFHQPTIFNIDNNVFQIVEIAINIFYNFKLFLKNNNVKCIVNTFAGYIQHAIPVRIADEAGIEIFTMGSKSYLIQKYDDKFPYCSINHTKFRPDRTLPEGAIELAEGILSTRLKGGVDPATYYMKESSFAVKPFIKELTDKFNEKARNIVIYAHEFYDAPHINRKLQFPDLFQYLNEVLKNLVDLDDTNVFIKTHPGGMTGTKEVAIELIESFNASHFHVLDETVSNVQIVHLRPDIVATARGSVGVEMSYFEIPVIALYDNPYVNFNFVHTCYDKETYFDILKGKEFVQSPYSKTDIYSYYYQAFLEQKILKESNVYTFLSSFDGDTYNDEYLEYLFSNGFSKRRKELISHYEKSLKNIRAEQAQLK